MYNEQKTKNITANSTIDQRVIVSMSCTKLENGSISQNISIVDADLYQKNKKECDKDIETFKAHAEDL